MSESPSFMNFMNITNTITQLLLGAVALSAIFFANIFSSTTSLKQHIYLCVTGYIILMSQAILSLTPYSGWTKSLSFEQKKTVHWVMQIVGSILAITGSIIRITSLTTNFTTAHGIFGLIAMIFTFLSLLGGVANLFSSQMNLNTRIIKICHSLFGTVTICCAFITLCLGFDNNYRVTLGSINADLSISLTVFALVGTILASTYNLSRRLMN